MLRAQQRLFVLPTVEISSFTTRHENIIGDSQVYQCRNHTFTVEQLVVKRAMDIAFSLIGIVLTSPIMLLSALIIKLQDGGPVLFKQERYTRNYERFTLYKFRSMIVDAEKAGAMFTRPTTPHHAVWKIYPRDADRRTAAVLQYLHGEMSLVGRAAERIENVDLYVSGCREFRYRMKVKGADRLRTDFWKV